MGLTKALGVEDCLGFVSLWGFWVELVFGLRALEVLASIGLWSFSGVLEVGCWALYGLECFGRLKGFEFEAELA